MQNAAGANFITYPQLPATAPTEDRHPATKEYVDDATADFDPTLSTDHTYSGQTTTEVVGESVEFGDLLYFDWTDKEYKKAAKGAEATMPTTTIALESKANGESCLLLRRGFIRDDSWTFGAAIVMTGAAGAPTTTLPDTEGDQVQRIGTAIAASKMYFNPDLTVVEVPA